MEQLKYQLKNIRRDKLCILTFLLPVIVGIIIRFLPAMNFLGLSETSFGCVQNDLSKETISWLQSIGNLTEYETIETLKEGVNNPSTQMIGVLRRKNSIRTILSGDEFELYEAIGKTLPQLDEMRADQPAFSKTISPVSEKSDKLKFLFIAMTLVTAMFMGCTFNSMNMISEKEEGTAFVNQILPMSMRAYLLQKLALGFLGGIVSAMVTAFLCIRTDAWQTSPLFLLVILSAYIASLVGLFIGHFSSGLMTGMVCIKIIMILFLAPPIIFYLTVSTDSAVYPLSYLFPSSAAFYGLMELLAGQMENLGLYLVILSIHAVLLTCLYFFIVAGKGSNRR